MSKTYRTVIAVTLERPIDETDKRCLETHIISAIKGCDGSHHAVVPSLAGYLKLKYQN